MSSIAAISALCSAVALYTLWCKRGLWGFIIEAHLYKFARKHGPYKYVVLLLSVAILLSTVLALFLVQVNKFLGNF